MMKYERLTFRYESDGMKQVGYTEKLIPCFNKQAMILNRLAELEDKIENGTLVELPCKVGDTVYGFSCYRQFGSLRGKIFEGKVVAFYIERGLYLRIEAEHDNGNFYLEYGKDVFLTCEEAEKRLKELQE